MHRRSEPSLRCSSDANAPDTYVNVTLAALGGKIRAMNHLIEKTDDSGKRFEVSRSTLVGCLTIAALLGIGACTADNESQPTTAAPTPSERRPVAAEPAGEGESTREVVSESLAYGEVDDNLVYGHFVIPADMVEPLPAVIVVHDWWGLNDAVRARAERLAAQGFIVLAVDMFGGATADISTDARKLEIAVLESPQLALENLGQASEFLRNVAGAPAMAILGYGFGGSWALNAALDDASSDLSAVATFYGQVTDDERRLANLSTPLIGFFAEGDRAVPSAAVERFEQVLIELGKEHDIQMFGGVRRGFANVQSENFDASADEESWSQLVSFLSATLNRSPAN